jgi:hypothetical protein
MNTPNKLLLYAKKIKKNKLKGASWARAQACCRA